jgi:hypothetical protein
MFTLAPVSDGLYPCSDGQVWADPNIGHAAALMRRLFDEDAYRREIARAGRRYVFDNFDEKTIGMRYSSIHTLKTAGSFAYSALVSYDTGLAVT